MTINPHEIRRIRALPLFSGISPQVLDDILAEGVVRVRSTGQEVFCEGDPVDRFFIVLSGWVRLYRVNAAGHVTTVEIFGPGESFAEGAMHMDTGYPVSAEIIATGRLLEIPTSTFAARLRDDPNLALNMLAAMAIQLKKFIARQERMATLSAPQRVATFLLRFADHVETGDDCAVIALPYDKQLIASRLGMTPETLSRSFRRLRDVGVIVRDDEIHINAVRSLKNFAAST